MKMNKSGFTLVELLAVIALVAILSGLAVANVVSSINNSKKNNFLMDAKRMISKAEYLMSQNRKNREEAKSSGITFSYNDLNEKNEFSKDADGGNFDTNSYVKVTYNNNQYEYCICVIGSQRKIGDKCDSSSEAVCVLSTNLTSIDVVNDKEEN